MSTTAASTRTMRCLTQTSMPLPDYLREREFAPRRRKPLAELLLPV